MYTLNSFKKRTSISFQQPPFQNGLTTVEHCHLDKTKELQSNSAHYATIFAFTIKYSLCFGGFRYGQWTSMLSFCKSKSSLDYIFLFGSSGYITTYQWTLQWTNLIFNGVIQANHCVKHQFILCTLKKVKYMQNQYH